MTTTAQDIEQLNSFLRGEISAVETFDQAIESADDVAIIATLTGCRDDHAERVQLLRQEITGLGGQPSDGSGVWGAFAKAVEGGAKVFGTSAAVAALKQGEEHGLKDYERDLTDLGTAAREMVATRLLPAQLRTHDAISRLDEIV
ncbi:hypothetical protein Poly30_35030 [Planctomycetes bacterium Poly30]|uniref:DUF2383 domain-containing protein n=1 Tax=Saltatorellus ferox TaxID=2528018 RepID=A0A518EV49_9BACT|nr:hypothetical protein Poly30_35030 [Planctomycetes bacterium Poly30]